MEEKACKLGSSGWLSKEGGWIKQITGTFETNNRRWILKVSFSICFSGKSEEKEGRARESQDRS